MYSTPSKIKSDDKKDIILLTAAVNGRSMFHDLTVGADHAMSGVVALLAAADALKKVLFYLISVNRRF